MVNFYEKKGALKKRYFKKGTYLSVRVFSTVVLIVDTVNKQTNITNRTNLLLRIPTGGRLTSWLFTKRGGVEFGTKEDKSIQWQGAGFEPVTSGLQVQCPTTRPRCLLKGWEVQ